MNSVSFYVCTIHSNSLSRKDAPCHYLNQCWFLIKSVLWLAPESIFTRCAPDINPWNEFQNYTVEIELQPHLPRAAELSKICFVHVTEFYSISSYIKLNANQIWFFIWKLNRTHAIKCFSEQNKCLVRFALADYTDIFYYSTADACGHPAESPCWYLARKGNTFP